MTRRPHPVFTRLVRLVLLSALLLVKGAQGLLGNDSGWRVEVHQIELPEQREEEESATRRPRQIELRQSQQEPPVGPTFSDLVTPHGYGVENHEVTTEDGYILALHRMPAGPKSPAARHKPVVLFLHGLLASSDIWVIRGPEKDLPFMLVDAGYDVWLLNTRGNFYSRRHKYMLPNSDGNYWKFSWHECGIYDAPASIDYILNATGEEKLSIIGHSMGTTVSYVLLTEKPEYNNKVAVLISLAPVAVFTHVLPGPLSSFAIRYGNQLQETLHMFGIYEIFPRGSMLSGVYRSFCKLPKIELICQHVILLMAGLMRTSQFLAIESEVIEKTVDHYPAGASVGMLFHYKQIMMSGKFRQFDYGPPGNMYKYNSAMPPEYSLERVTAPTVIYYGMNDAYTTKEDVAILLKKLPQAEERVVPEKLFGHLDFLFSSLAKELLYEDIIRVIDRHNNGNFDNNVNSSTTTEFPRRPIDQKVEEFTPDFDELTTTTPVIQSATATASRRLDKALKQNREIRYKYFLSLPGECK